MARKVYYWKSDEKVEFDLSDSVNTLE